MALASEQLSWITARLGVARLGAFRLGEVGPAGDLKENVAATGGQVIWDRDVPNDGNPDNTAVAYTTVRD